MNFRISKEFIMIDTTINLFKTVMNEIYIIIYPKGPENYSTKR